MGGWGGMHTEGDGMKVRKRADATCNAEQFDMLKEPYPKVVQKRYLDGEPNKMQGSRVQFFIETLEGEHIVSDGDWILTSDDGGESWPVKPDRFAATYEPVEQP